jgi:hypothetical protein
MAVYAALIAFSTMWLKDVYLPYVYPGCSQLHQLIVAKIFSTIGLGIGELGFQTPMIPVESNAISQLLSPMTVLITMHELGCDFSTPQAFLSHGQ